MRLTLIILLVMLLGLYPVAELTRIILADGVYYYPALEKQFFSEIAIMWGLYFLIIPVLLFNEKLKEGG